MQESLSNAVRHGAPTRHPHRDPARPARRLRVEVVNDGAADGAAAARGFGLTGMAERVAAAGGTLAAGPAGGGGWRVAARLPLKPLERADEAA